MSSRATTRSPRLDPADLLRAEWIKLRSLRSSRLTVAAASVTVLAIAISIAISVASSEQVQPELATPEAPLGGYLLAQLILGVLGALLVTGEYASGMIRATFAAVPSRLPVLVAKTIVFGLATLAAMSATALVAFLAAQGIIGGDRAASLADPGVMRSVAGVGAYLAFAGLLGSALGWILRTTAAAIGSLTGLLLLLPTLALLLPTSVQETVIRFLPSNAGEAIIATVPEATLLGPWAGLGVLALWLVGALGLAAVLVRRRDA